MEQQIFEALVYAIARQTEREFYAMPRFKVGDRVKIVGKSVMGHDQRIGEIVKVKYLTGDDYVVDPQIDWNGANKFSESSLELAPRFKVGDEVRVKAGSPKREHAVTTPMEHPYYTDFGVKLKIKDKALPYGCLAVETEDGWSESHPDYLEPWNPAEEWNGSAWVKKEVAKPCLVGRRGSTFYTPVDSTNEAFRKAEEFANECPGHEYVVYQEKGSRRVEKKSKAEQIAEVAALPASIEVHDGTKVDVTSRVVSVIQDEVTVIYKIKS